VSNDFLRNSTQNHKLVVTEDKSQRKCLKDKNLPVWIFLKRMKRPTSSLLNKPSILPNKIQNQQSGCDSVAATYGIGKTKAITVLREGHARQISPTWSNSQLISWLHAMVAKHHALPRRNAASSCGHRKQESQQQHRNCVVCHQQLKHLSKIFTEHTFRLPSGIQCPEWRSTSSQCCGLRMGSR